MADVKALAESLVSLTVKEVKELADVLKADYGIEPAAVAVAASGAGDAGGPPRATRPDSRGTGRRAGRRRAVPPGRLGRSGDRLAVDSAP